MKAGQFSTRGDDYYYISELAGFCKSLEDCVTTRDRMF